MPNLALTGEGDGYRSLQSTKFDQPVNPDFHGNLKMEI